MIIMDSVVIPRPPAPPPMPTVIAPFQPPLPKPPTSTTPSFRLLDTPNNNNQDDTGSVYSIYKQKIDAMFESDSTSSTTKNSVQARIEKMFTDVAKDTNLPLTPIGTHSFSIDYLGSVALSEKVTSLAGLQHPLHDLYFAYKKAINNQKKQLTGRLEISTQGLKVQYQGDKGDLEQMNSFPTIAVWSAVKFVIQKERYAFLPLITDPDNIDKRSLFRQLDIGESRYIGSTESHSPLFAVVMRKIGVQKQLECHGFVCQTSEDAIVIAATLYKSLMAHMRAKEKKPKSRNGIHCMSIASSTCNDVPVRPPRKKRSTTSSVSEAEVMSDTQPLLGKPPKKSVKAKRAPKAPSGDFDAILAYEEPVAPPVEEIKPKTFSDKISTFMSREQKQITAEIKQVMSESSNRGLKHVEMKEEKEKGTVRKKDNTGDILTKVTIPRSGSFLNAGGLTRYKSKVSRANGQATGGSPLGFNELFNEFRLQEGLHSMDEILGVIIDPDGMSFNDLKPIYKEFLLKLSVTLTKDELYQRSKSIMRRQKKKLLRRHGSTATTSVPARVYIVGGKFKRLKHIFQKSFRKTKKHTRRNRCQTTTVAKQLPESSISTASYDTRQFTPRPPSAAAKKTHQKLKSGKKTSRKSSTTEEESDCFFTSNVNRRRNNKQLQHQHNRNSSSGYVSCSECSYDSDTCTCVSADKCYCSLGGKKPPMLPNRASQTSFCDCDTDSCTESNKCYCQIVKRGAAAAPGGKLSDEQHRKLCKKASNTKSTRSLEYMHNPVESTYYEKLKTKSFIHNSQQQQSKRRRNSLNGEMSSNMATLDYDLFNTIQSQAAAYAAVAAMNKQASMRSYASSKFRTGRSLHKSTQIHGACTEALSVKKSAEIAALFADIKLSQTTDIAHLAQIDSILTSKNAYNRLKSPSQYHPTSNFPSSMAAAAMQQKIIQNGLYGRMMTSSNQQMSNKSNMYSARNGLYTIQSQSDESRRSSLSDGAATKHHHHEYFELDHPVLNSSRTALKKTASNNTNLENSLGYLP